MPPNPPSNAHGFAMRSMSLRDMQIPKSEKKILAPPPPKSWGRPWIPYGPADFPHSNFDTISVILLAETAMSELCWTFCNLLQTPGIRLLSQSFAFNILYKGSFQ